MSQINEIISFYWPTDKFILSAQKVIPTSVINQLENRIIELKKISKKLGESSFSFSDESLVESVISKFRLKIFDSSIIFNRRESRILAFSLDQGKSIFENEFDLKYAFYILDENWNDRYLNGLILLLIKKWGLEHLKCVELLGKYISDKLEKYEGTNGVLISFKRNKKFFNTTNGDIILGDYISKKQENIEIITSILGVPESWITYPYFSNVFVTYYEKSKERIAIILDELYSALQSHNNTITNKRLISKMIIYFNQPEHIILQDRIKKLAFKLIGDPGTISNWAEFENANATEKFELTQARKILNEWITKEFINVFFNVCINDERRKKFWLNLSSKVSTFKVYGPTHTKNILKRDQRISEIVDARFHTVVSSKDVSAFILFIGNHRLIEFSNEGYAFYAYKVNSAISTDVIYKLNSVDDLRNSSLPMAITSDSNYYYFNDEGRLFHKDGNESWESKFNKWINKKVIE